jgi:hypothetical protein
MRSDPELLRLGRYGSGNIIQDQEYFFKFFLENEGKGVKTWMEP